ncbi:hypothetical protein [Curtobacterium oceanosedimentum]|uniref:hypothetical protein n=1 Tax=Curtobacterium oceanosedimentum TaxID=465820 RepID=UPI000AFC3E8B|nr:hypothetical protein [Curtobacterium oceanosedimentum]
MNRSPKIIGGSRLDGVRRRSLRVTHLAGGSERAAARVRAQVVQLSAQQEGLVTLEQINRRVPRAIAIEGAAALVRRGELATVIDAVWVHRAVGRLPLWDRLLEAQARWLALDPRWTVRERHARTLPSLQLSVIGGNAACQHWEIRGLWWSTELLVPSPSRRVRSDEEVDVLEEAVDPVDVVWEAGFPILRPEPLLARAYEATGDLDRVGEALQELMRRTRLRPSLLEYHCRVIEERSNCNADRRDFAWLYDAIVARAGGWPSREGPTDDDEWWDRAAHLRRVRAQHPEWCDLSRLPVGEVELRNGGPAEPA